jgi:hypothetical protein
MIQIIKYYLEITANAKMNEIVEETFRKVNKP